MLLDLVNLVALGPAASVLCCPIFSFDLHRSHGRKVAAPRGHTTASKDSQVIPPPLSLFISEECLFLKPSDQMSLISLGTILVRIA